MPKFKPEGMQTVTPSFAVEGCADAIVAYVKVFGAVEKNRALDPSGKMVWHAHLMIGDSNLFMNDYAPGMGMNSKGGQSLWVYAEDADEMFERAKTAGFKVNMEMSDQFWGDRMGSVMDRWGNTWIIAKHIKDMTPDEMKKAGEEFAKSMMKK
jgi:PhnB protein